MTLGRLCTPQSSPVLARLAAGCEQLLGVTLPPCSISSSSASEWARAAARQSPFRCKGSPSRPSRAASVIEAGRRVFAERMKRMWWWRPSGQQQRGLDGNLGTRRAIELVRDQMHVIWPTACSVLQQSVQAVLGHTILDGSALVVRLICSPFAR
jgi:hypothetical protein